MAPPISTRNEQNSWSGFGVELTPSTDNGSLQKLADEENHSKDPFKTWIYAPLIVFFCIAAAVLTIQFRRRRRKVNDNTMLHQALTRDIEALTRDAGEPTNEVSSNQSRLYYVVQVGADGRPQSAQLLATATTSPRPSPHPTSPCRAGTLGRIGIGRFGFTPSRWQWNLPSMARRQPEEEGLNELGEAPPPYDSTKQQMTMVQQQRRPATSTTTSTIATTADHAMPPSPSRSQRAGARDSITTNTTNTNSTTTTPAPIPSSTTTTEAVASIPPSENCSTIPNSSMPGIKPSTLTPGSDVILSAPRPTYTGR